MNPESPTPDRPTAPPPPGGDDAPREGAAGEGVFPETRWSQIAVAKGSDEEANRAFENLCRAYWQPVFVAFRERASSWQDAEDLTQEFFASLQKRRERDLRVLDPAAGTFRSYLRAAIGNFWKNHRRKDRALSRGGGRRNLSLDAEIAHDPHANEPADPAGVADTFDVHFAKAVLGRAMQRFRVQQVRTMKPEVFDALVPALPFNAREIPFEELAARYDLSSGSLRTSVTRMRARLRKRLFEEVVPTVKDPAEAPDELRYLLSLVGSEWELLLDGGG